MNNNKIIGVIIDEPIVYRIIFDNNIISSDIFKSFVIFKYNIGKGDIGFSTSGDSMGFIKNPIGLNNFIDMITDKKFYTTKESNIAIKKLLDKINSIIEENGT